MGCRLTVCVSSIVLCWATTSSAQPLPPELAAFQSHPRNPVFEAAPGKWDALIRERGWILRDGDMYRMWYTGYPSKLNPGKMGLGYASSPDGVNWKRHSPDPIYSEVWTEDMMIVQKDDTLFMFAEGENDQSQLLKSQDGIHWERVGRLDIRLTTGQPIPPGPYGTPTAWFENDIWSLFYERRDSGIWPATSTDMKVWTNVSDTPIIVPGPEKYDALMIAMNQIVRHDGKYYAVMHGTGTPTKPRAWCTYFAESTDLRHWQKCTDGPVLPVKDNRSSGVLVHDGKQFRLYTMHGRVDLHLPKSIVP